MSGIYIKGVSIPQKGDLHVVITSSGFVKDKHGFVLEAVAIPVPDHGRLIDADALRARMYHEAFETDTPMQKWDSGCWIRYKMFERMEESAPTIIPADPADKEGDNG